MYQAGTPALLKIASSFESKGQNFMSSEEIRTATTITAAATTVAIIIIVLIKTVQEGKETTNLKTTFEQLP